LKELAPYSDEPAETLVTAIMTRCSQHEEKIADLAVAALSLPRSAVEIHLTQERAKHRQRLIALVVTFRAEMRKAGTQLEPRGRSLPEGGGGRLY
jgi:hypothetical protein